MCRLRDVRAGMCLALLALVAGCGGGGGSGSPSAPPATANTLPITVDLGPAGNFINLATVSVTVCTPGSTTQCQTIDHIQVDTGSSGLRILASALSPALGLTQQSGPNGGPLVECFQYVDGFVWGPVKAADIQLAGESAHGVPIQVIGDPGFPTIPSSCSNAGPPENDTSTLGANGVMGIGFFLEDCGPTCAASAVPGFYYTCADVTNCQPSAVPLAQQAANPIALFTTENNGVIVTLPSLVPGGAATAAGSLILGIGTQADNGLGSATVYTVDASTGTLTTTLNGKLLPDSYIDSGSSAFYFSKAAYPPCTGPGSGLYCPASTQSLSANITGANSANVAVNFSVANADQLFNANPNFAAFADIAGPNSDTSSFAWGLPFFFGRQVYTAFEGRSTPSGPGPFNAF
jgi:Protein of unknown function (DUF3443)